MTDGIFKMYIFKSVEPPINHNDNNKKKIPNFILVTNIGCAKHNYHPIYNQDRSTHLAVLDCQ